MSKIMWSLLIIMMGTLWRVQGVFTICPKFFCPKKYICPISIFAPNFCDCPNFIFALFYGLPSLPEFAQILYLPYFMVCPKFWNCPKFVVALFRFAPSFWKCPKFAVALFRYAPSLMFFGKLEIWLIICPIYGLPYFKLFTRHNEMP